MYFEILWIPIDHIVWQKGVQGWKEGASVVYFQNIAYPYCIGFIFAFQIIGMSFLIFYIQMKHFDVYTHTLVTH